MSPEAHFFWLSLAALTGWLIKVLEKVILLRETNRSMTLALYVFEDRYRVALSVLGTIVLMFISYASDQLNFSTAVASGYVGESASRFLRSIADSRIGNAR